VAALPKAFTGGAVGAERLPKEVIAEHQRQRLLEAAVAVIAKRGYNATTLDHILAAAKVGVGTFYELFENKEACFLTAYETTIERGKDLAAAAVAAESGWGERVLAGLRAVLAFIATEPLAARFAIVEVQSAGPAALARYEEMLEEATAALRTGRGLSAGAKKLPASLEFSLVGGVVWVLQQRIAAGEVRRIEAALPQLFEILAEPYLGERQVADLLATD
jgi:AcrR family transcriptional regulator